ncbi:MAG: tetratricopeptide repeat protein [Wenzhouxiangellaceae bacterium]|nr:tetratricopeptide repeat protein [Wenzhouxiangellaceae bacterium]
MNESESDKPDIVLAYAVQCKIVGLIAGSILLALATGCAGPGEPAGPAVDPDDQAALRDARAAVAAGDYEHALDTLVEVLDRTRDPGVVRQAAQLALAVDDLDTAERAAGRWLELEPDSRSAVQVAVITALRQERAGRAVELLSKRIIEPDPDQGNAWTTATGLLAAADSPEIARQALDRLIELHPAKPADAGFAAWQRSRLAWQLGERERAFALAREAFAAQPGYGRAMWAARIAQSLSAPEDALQYFRAAREIRAGDRDAVIAEAEALRELGRSDEALDVLALLPEEPEVLYMRSALQHDLGRDTAAAATWRRLAALTPGTGQARHAWLTGLMAEVLGFDAEAIDWYARVEGELAARADLRRAVLMAGRGRLDAARQVLAGVRRGGDPETIEQAWLLEGQLLIDNGRDQATMDLYSDALVRVPGSTALLYARAMHAVNLDQLALAEQDLRAIIQREPENAVALNALGYTLSDRTDRHREALRLIERALALEPENPAILDSMGWVLYKIGRPAQGLPYIEQAVAADPHPEIVAHLIEMLWALDRRGEARDWVKRTRAEYAGEAVYERTLERIGLQ